MRRLSALLPLQKGTSLSAPLGTLSPGPSYPWTTESSPFSQSSNFCGSARGTTRREYDEKQVDDHCRRGGSDRWDDDIRCSAANGRKKHSPESWRDRTTRSAWRCGAT